MVSTSTCCGSGGGCEGPRALSLTIFVQSMDSATLSVANDYQLLLPSFRTKKILNYLFNYLFVYVWNLL